MVYLIGGHVSFRNDQRRDAAVTAIQNFIAPLAGDMFHPPQVGAYDGTRVGWPHALNFVLVLRTLANRDQLWTQADQALGSGTNGPITRSFLYRLDSNMDVPGMEPPDVNYQERSY